MCIQGLGFYMYITYGHTYKCENTCEYTYIGGVSLPKKNQEIWGGGVEATEKKKYTYTYESTYVGGVWGVEASDHQKSRLQGQVVPSTHRQP